MIYLVGAVIAALLLGARLTWAWLTRNLEAERELYTRWGRPRGWE